MARKLDLDLDQKNFAAPPALNLPVILDAEETFLTLSQQQKTSLNLSPQLQEWFGKDRPTRSDN